MSETAMIHCCLDIKGAMRSPKDFIGCITVDGKTLNTVSEIQAFFQYHLDMGHRVLPLADCDNFDYQTGCKGHKKD